MIGLVLINATPISFRLNSKALTRPKVSEFRKNHSKIDSGESFAKAPLGNGVAELRIHYEPGIRLYFSTIGNEPLDMLISRYETLPFYFCRCFWMGNF